MDEVSATKTTTLTLVTYYSYVYVPLYAVSVVFVRLCGQISVQISNLNIHENSFCESWTVPYGQTEGRLKINPTVTFRNCFKDVP